MDAQGSRDVSCWAAATTWMTTPSTGLRQRPCSCCAKPPPPFPDDSNARRFSLLMGTEVGPFHQAPGLDQNGTFAAGLIGYKCLFESGVPFSRKPTPELEPNRCSTNFAGGSALRSPLSRGGPAGSAVARPNPGRRLTRDPRRWYAHQSPGGIESRLSDVLGTGTSRTAAFIPVGERGPHGGDPSPTDQLTPRSVQGGAKVAN